jgi:hypothetical protein
MNSSFDQFREDKGKHLELRDHPLADKVILDVQLLAQNDNEFRNAVLQNLLAPDIVQEGREKTTRLAFGGLLWP